MKKYLLSIALMSLFSFANPAFAAPKPILRGGACVTNLYRNVDSIFSCEHIGDVTIKQIYEKGWKIVSSYSQYWSAHPYYTTTLIIEQQG